MKHGNAINVRLSRTIVGTIWDHCRIDNVYGFLFLTNFNPHSSFPFIAFLQLREIISLSKSKMKVKEGCILIF